MNKSQQIDAYLQKHFPCMAVPHGQDSIIAERFGVTRELVRQRRKAHGMPMIFKGQAVCVDCGKKLSGNRDGERRCQTCFSKSRRLDLVCEVCGRVFTRLLSDQKKATDVGKHGRATQQVICSWICRANAQGEKIKAVRAVKQWGPDSYTPPEPCPQCGGVKSRSAQICRACWAAKRGEA